MTPPKQRILVIEDEAAMRRNLALMLKLEGFEVESAPNGAAGLEMAARFQPHLVLCDVTMPEMDGYEVVQTLRLNPATATLPFIFLTGRADKADHRIGMNFGANDYLTKPVGRDDLLAAVEARLAHAEAVEQRVKAAAGAAGFAPDFSSAGPLQRQFGLTARQAEVLLWIAQGKSNSEAAIILSLSEKTVKQHLGVVFEKLGVESRTAAAVCALEVLSARRA